MTCGHWKQIMADAMARAVKLMFDQDPKTPEHERNGDT